ncbi:MAG TPA: hypothetical protein VF686_07105, partial [Brevundimonas sp.]
MSSPTETAPVARPPLSRTTLLGIGGVIVCAMIWGTTWYAITLQLGTVAPLASIVWRFGLASALLFLGCLIFRLNLRLTWPQHLA